MATQTAKINIMKNQRGTKILLVRKAMDYPMEYSPKKPSEYILILKTCFEERKLKNHRYSLRAFARDLDIDNGNLKRLLDGKLSITPRTAFRLGRQLRLDGQDLLKFVLPTLE